MMINTWTLGLSLFVFLATGGTARLIPHPAPEPGKAQYVVLDDFQSYKPGGLPVNWQVLEHRTIVPVTPDAMTDREQFFIVEEQSNKFVRARVTDEAHRILMMNGQRFDWNIEDFPYLQWDWRAIQLPKGAREDQHSMNDTGAALYVFFDKDWLGRPLSIKYTYSSTLPVGTEVSFGVLKVMVVASGADGVGQWKTIERNVAADYERLFGRTPPERPISIALWSDADNTHQTAIADFDNIMLFSGPTAGK